jgi:hypothetical protein
MPFRPHSTPDRRRTPWSVTGRRRRPRCPISRPTVLKTDGSQDRQRGRPIRRGSGILGCEHESGKFVAFPSGDTLLRSGEVPVNRVERYAGHFDVNHVLSETLGVDRDSNVGFVAVMKGDGSFDSEGPLVPSTSTTRRSR